MTDVVLKSLDTNADFVVLVEWVIPEGGQVALGETICYVETSKAVIEVSAPSAGLLSHRARVDEVVAGQAVRQLGLAQERAARVDEAAQVFREDLTRNPRNGRSLFGLWQAHYSYRAIVYPLRMRGNPGGFP